MLANNTRNAFVALSKRPYICQSCLRRAKQLPLASGYLPIQGSRRNLQTTSQPPVQDDTPFRKALKDAAKQQKKASKGGKKPKKGADPRLEKWELTVGIEIHAELNTARKLFSSAATSVSETPNTHASLFDTAFPGSQPHFQKETLLPALRAALAFDCTIQPRSSFDRKHYFYQDQPNGYQITQYYEPFAKDGSITLYAHDFPAGSAPEDCPFKIGIKQVQMEQDTAKTVQQPPSTHLLDFNRVSHPLIEIITLPHIHDPLVAAACVRKIQTILKTVDACTAGMEVGGLRADVNVSIRERGQTSTKGGLSYSGVTGLGQRTEIKNLASVKAVEDAISAERDRQIELLESGGAVEGETRGWTVGSKTTKRLRGKEGEIDYRYMPDPDISPIFIAQDLIDHLRTSLPVLPDRIVDVLVEKYGLSTKDAGTLLSFDNGNRLEYYFEVTNQLARARSVRPSDAEFPVIGKAVGNWVLMELGSLYKDEEWSETRIPPEVLVSIINQLLQKRITSRSAKRLLAEKFEGEQRDIEQLIEDYSMVLRPLSPQEYRDLAQTLLDEKLDMVRDIVEKGQEKKIKWFVGQMMARSPEGTVEADVAEFTLKELLPKAGTMQ
ncbi:PET112 family protein [Stagonosporopsis vannaccii]|nr:PET112 family protein [Stagonosporopsis vannaccii]